MTLRTSSLIASATLATLLALPSMASAEPLEGSLTDALTGYPVEGSLVRVAGTTFTTMTDAEGRWAFDLPRGIYQIDFESELGDHMTRVSLVSQHVPQYKQAHARLYTTWFSDQGVPDSVTPMGVPTTSGQLPANSPDSIKLPTVTSNPLALIVSDPIPRRIRVARRERPHESCRDNPVVAIEEMDIDEYVKGVLPPEIGVFQRIDGALETYKAFGIAAKSYGLWFMLTYDETNRRKVEEPAPPHGYTWFHIDDTACNQRYSDERLPLTTRAAEAIANKILVKKGEPDVLDKLEYAASCGRHGTLPEYGMTSALVPDVPPTNACAGSWCGHDACAGHEDNPNLPGTDRCLVRGMCQWGTASWGKSGKDYLWILSHYQPNLELRDLQQPQPGMQAEIRGRVYTRAGDIAGSGVANLTVSLSEGQRTVTSAQGAFSFSAVTAGSVTLTASGAGFITTTQTADLVADDVNDVNILITRDRGTSGSQDMGESSTRDMSGPMNLSDQGNTGIPSEAEEFDDLLTTSSGVEGGCHQSPAPGPPRVPDSAPGLLGLLGVLVWRRREQKG